MNAFFISCNPPRSTAQSTKRIGVRKDGKPFSFTTAKGKQQEADFMSLLMPHVPEKPCEGPLKLTIIYKLPFLSNEKKAVKERGWEYHIKKPDSDNLLKLFQDTMGKLLFWNDDAQVVELAMKKIRHQQPGIYVHLIEIDETDRG
jgi:Holliday junction resolvase RusA-like endonuclease